MSTEAVIAELNWLVDNGIIVGYAIGGAVAAFYYIEPAFTQDLDVFVVFDAKAHPLAPVGPIWEKLIERGAAVDRDYLVIGGWRVQFLPAGTPLSDEAVARAREFQVGDQTSRVMAPEYLAAIALETGRGKDYARVEEFLTRKVVDKSAMLELVKRFGLTERWKTFETRFLTGNA